MGISASSRNLSSRETERSSGTVSRRGQPIASVGSGPSGQTYDQAMFQNCRVAAWNGNPYGQVRLGWCYKNGKGTPVDYQKAVEWYTMAAENGVLEAQFHLAYCYEDGKGVAVDYKKAFYWYTRAAEGGHPEAQCTLGFCYTYGRGTTVNHPKAFEWYMRASENGSTTAQFNIGNCYMEGRGTAANAQKAMEWYTKSSLNGCIEAQSHLGIICLLGKGTAVDYPKAFEYLTKAAESGNLQAQNNLALCYFKGDVTTVDIQKALELLRKAAEGGYPEAQYNLGYCYERGSEITVDYQKALEWYIKAADGGITKAQYSVGFFYEYGRGTAIDYKKSLEWQLKAAEGGMIQAQINVARCYQYGRGTEVNYQQALKWFKKAVESGDFEAQNAISGNENLLQEMHFIKKSEKINSGNEFVDEFIGLKPFLDWIPNDSIKNMEYIGKGGFSTIYKANFIPFKPYHKCDTVAVKCINNSENIEAILSEAKHYLEVDSDCVIHIFGISKHPETGKYMLVMEWCENGDLRKNLSKKNTYLGFCMTIYMIARGLSTIHSKGLCHKDLHPGNILLKDQYTKLYISDLGLCGPKDQTGKVVGVLPYIAPELIRGDPYTKAADIYSLGMIMCVLLTQEQPFKEMDWRNKPDLRLAKEKDNIHPELPNWAPDWVTELILKCWDPDPLKRPCIHNIYDLVLDAVNLPYAEFPIAVSECESLPQTRCLEEANYDSLSCE